MYFKLDKKKSNGNDVKNIKMLMSIVNKIFVETKNVKLFKIIKMLKPQRTV